MWTRIISCMMRPHDSHEASSYRIYAFTCNNYRIQHKIQHIFTNNESISKFLDVLKSWDLALSRGNNTVAQLSLLDREKQGFVKIHRFFFLQYSSLIIVGCCINPSISRENTYIWAMHLSGIWKQLHSWVVFQISSRSEQFCDFQLQTNKIPRVEIAYSRPQCEVRLGQDLQKIHRKLE